MNEIRCSVVACDKSAFAHVKHVQSRKISKLIHLCEHHSKTHFEEEHGWYYSNSRVGIGEPLTTDASSAFDIDFLYWDNSYEPPFIWGRHYVHLREIGGLGNFGFELGAEESNALNFVLDNSESPRPLTHQSMATVIDALGGKLTTVSIDKYRPDNKVYEAKLHVTQEKKKVITDLRPSDAIILALIKKVPIMVAKKLFKSPAS